MLQEHGTNHTVIISPLNNLYGALCGAVPAAGGMLRVNERDFGCGVANIVGSVAEGAEMSALIFAGEGVTQTLVEWGAALQRYYSTRRVPLTADLVR